jgi:hypothetical protein
MDRRSTLQNPDFIVAREGEVEAEVLFHCVLNIQKKLLVPECLAIIEKARSAGALACVPPDSSSQPRAAAVHIYF